MRSGLPCARAGRASVAAAAVRNPRRLKPEQQAQLRSKRAMKSSLSRPPGLQAGECLRRMFADLGGRENPLSRTLAIDEHRAVDGAHRAELRMGHFQDAAKR